jgi:predicted DNA-binding transcriptional regulator AlpA
VDKLTNNIPASEAVERQRAQLARILLNEDEAGRAIGLTARFLTERRRKGDGPPYIRISSRCVRYRPEDIEAWAESLRRTSTSDSGRAA